MLNCVPEYIVHSVGLHTVYLLFLLVTSMPQLNRTVSVISSQIIQLSWMTPLHLKNKQILFNYHVIIQETQILYLDSGTVTSQMGMNFNRTYNFSEARTQLIDMLHPSYNYTVRIAAATVVGIGPFSDPITVMTLEDGEDFAIYMCPIF